MARTLLQVYETTTVAGANSGNDRTLGLQYAPATNDYRTPNAAPLVLAPVPLLKGDVLDIRLSMQYANDNSSARNAWTVNGQQSEHWSLWAMGANEVRVNDDLSDAGAYRALYQREANFDNYQHYQMVERSGFFTVPFDMPTGTIWVRTYFVASASYATAGQALRIIGGGYSKLQVGIFR